MDTPTNPQIAALLREYADLLELRGESPYRTQAYRRGAETIATYDQVVATLTPAERQAIPGIGKGLSAIISEITERGSFQTLDELRQHIPASVMSFTSLAGVGTKTAVRLYQSLGISTLAELQVAAEQGKVGTTAGLGKRLEKTVLDGLAQQSLVTPGRYGLGVALPLGLLFCRLLQERGQLQVSLAGSLRRWEETVGDIDLLVASDDPAAVLRLFTSLPPIAAILSQSEREIRATVDGEIAVHLRIVPPDHWGSALVAWSSAEGHRTDLRTLAAARGLTDIFTQPFADEVAFYAALGLPFLPPELREGRGEVAAALAGQVPPLITIDDILGDFHAHTTWSDGTASLRQMAEAAIARGYQYLGISDHTQGLTVANGLNVTRLREQWQEIDALNAEFAPFRLLKSAEVEIRRDGTLDFPDAVLAELDIVIASLHSGLRDDREIVTAKLLGAIRNPHVDIIAHPTGRIVGGRPGADYDWAQIFAAARETGTALEINASPERLDLNDHNARAALDAGVLLTIDCDAHSVDGLGLLPYGVAVARRAWATADQVLNTRPWATALARDASRSGA